MGNWKKLDDIQYKQAWDFVFYDLQFKPFEKLKLITLPLPKRSFDISRFYNEGFVEAYYDNLHDTAREWFDIVSNGKRMFALDWQHDCYSFTTNLPFERNEFGEWLIPVFPNGDYLFFLTVDFRNGIFSDGVNLQLSMWGENMLKAFEANTPEMLK